MKELSIEGNAYDGNYKAYTELINRLEDVKDAIKKHNYGIAMEILCKPYTPFQVITHSELKESEDEKIRKVLVRFHKGTIDIDGIKGEEILAWLEKQCEHAKFCDSIQVGDKVTRNEDGVLVNLSQLNRVAKKDEKQSEQKYAEKIEPKFKVGDVMRTLEEAEDGITDGMPVVVSIDERNYHCTNELISIKDQDEYEYPPMNRKQESAEWSEEDEELLKFSLENLTELKDRFGEEYGRVGGCIDWLKSLKGRVQPKQEWSDEDETALGDALWCCKQAASIAKDENDIGNAWYAENWLKSLRPQSHWKPSDEQMLALADAIETYCGKYKATLTSFYNVLKKLTE